MKEIVIEDPMLVLLIGSSGAGKSTFAKKHFTSTEIVSSDHYRAVVADDENDTDPQVSKDAFELVHQIIRKRLRRGLTTVVDATNLRSSDRLALKQLADEYKVKCMAIVLHLSEALLLERLQKRPDRNFNEAVVKKHYQRMLTSLGQLKEEGFYKVHPLESLEAIKKVKIVRQSTLANTQIEGSQFDIIGDVHGCFDELKRLLEKLGYQIQPTTERNTAPSFGYKVTTPKERKVIFVGDLVDRGNKTPEVLRLVMSMVRAGIAYCVRGNHDDKLYRKLIGRDVTIAHGLETSLEQLDEESEAFKIEVKNFLGSLISHYTADEGKLVVAHAGLKESLHGVYNKRSLALAMYGPTNGKKDEFGLPVRLDWAADYQGKAMVVYGHTPVSELVWRNNTINIDTACVFGGRLTALRYPSKETVQIKALQVYAVSKRPLVFD